MIIVRCEDVKKYFPIERGPFRQKTGIVKAVDGVSFEIEQGGTFGLVGESGCGKTTLGKLILGILKPDSGRVERKTDRLQVIFQDPYNSLDPKMKVRDILAEGLLLKKERGGLQKRVEGILDLVRLPKNSMKKYPHQFSGGERQRIAIGRAVLTQPELIVCDEPVSNLDATIQLQILNLLKEIQKKFGMTYLFISHDLRVIRYMAGKVAVMYQGRIVEEGPAEEIYSNPNHPYTKFLLSSIPEIS
jgi:ABC-type oligopeptide transport system ATPase subunit